MFGVEAVGFGLGSVLHSLSDSDSGLLCIMRTKSGPIGGDGFGNLAVLGAVIA